MSQPLLVPSAAYPGAKPVPGAVTRWAYLTTKAAVVMMAKQMTLDLAPYGIRVNVLCPGWFDTPFYEP
jgi:NAD(P)-dependent dehydrogenase (short-subunit alcohol dehydrogenase family)